MDNIENKGKPFKANELVKKDLDLSLLYERIRNENKYGKFKIFIPLDMYFSDESRIKLSDNGFKVYRGDWDGVFRNVYIIEW